MQPVLGTILTDHVTEFILKFGCDGVLTCIHVRDVGMFQSLCESCPSFVRDIIGLANV